LPIRHKIAMITYSEISEGTENLEMSSTKSALMIENQHKRYCVYLDSRRGLPTFVCGCISKNANQTSIEIS
jgi:hypothetical protein